jgi:hypothetical protein
MKHPYKFSIWAIRFWLALGISGIIFPVYAADAKWTWVRIEPAFAPNSAPWDVLQGTTSVVFDGNKFSAALNYDDEKNYRHYLVRGTIKNGDVVATEIQLNTDAAPQTFEGVIKKIRPPKVPFGFDQIILTNHASYIGLMRNVDSTTK